MMIVTYWKSTAGTAPSRLNEEMVDDRIFVAWRPSPHESMEIACHLGP
jgi:hypothetical protein